VPFEVAISILEKMEAFQAGPQVDPQVNLQVPRGGSSRGETGRSKKKLLAIFQEIVVDVLHEVDGSIDQAWVRKNVNAAQMMS